MPNWCSNSLRVEGPQPDIMRCVKFVKSKKEILDANKIIPYPKKFRKMDEQARRRADLLGKLREKVKFDRFNDRQMREFNYNAPPTIHDGYNRGGHEWCINNWGTKWGFCEAQILDRSPTSIDYSFETAWSPPLPLIKRLGKMFPRLHIVLNYEETGCGFQGELGIEAGKVYMDDSHEYRQEEEE